MILKVPTAFFPKPVDGDVSNCWHELLKIFWQKYLLPKKDPVAQKVSGWGIPVAKNMPSILFRTVDTSMILWRHIRWKGTDANVVTNWFLADRKKRRGNAQGGEYDVLFFNWAETAGGEDKVWFLVKGMSDFLLRRRSDDGDTGIPQKLPAKPNYVSHYWNYAGLAFGCRQAATAGHK